jgi:hypothetical protein
VSVGPGSARRSFAARSPAGLRRLALAALVTLVAGAAAAAPPAHAAAPALTLSCARNAITAGQTTTVTARLGVPGAVLVVSAGTGAPTYALVRTVVTDAAGEATWEVSPRRTTTYRVEFAGDPAWDAASAEITVSVRPRLTLTATSPVYLGWKVLLAARVVPAHPGATVGLERLVDGAWTPWRTLTLDASSRAAARWLSDVRPSAAFRLVMPADAGHVAGVGFKRSVLVRDPNPYDVPTRWASFIVVDKSCYRLYFHRYGRVVRVFDCVLGKPSTPTPLGRFRIWAKDPSMGGPYGPRRMRYLGNYAIHGTNEPWLLGRFPRAFSHGCTRLSNANILWLFDRCRVGTPVWNVP